MFTDIRPVWDPGMILTFSLSKVGLPGLRTGIVVADEDLVRRIASMTAIIGLANGNVGQAIVRPMLESGELVELSRDVIRPYYEQRSRRAESLLREAFRDDFPFAVHRSEGAFFLWLWFPELPITTRELYERLKARGVLIVPGEYFFYGLDDQAPWPHATQCLRMTFSQSHETIAAGVAIMADELRRAHGN
jgi:valine--pyruvate aminotransferase